MPPAAVTITASSRVVSSERPPRVPRFIEGDFAPLAYAAVGRCIGVPQSHLLEGHGDRASIVLSSVEFDTQTLELSVRQVQKGRISPVLFYQVLPTAVLGQIAIDYGITGPVSCVAATADPREEALEVAGLALAEGDADWIVALAVVLAEDPEASFASADLVRLASTATRSPMGSQ